MYKKACIQTETTDKIYNICILYVLYCIIKIFFKLIKYWLFMVNSWRDQSIEVNLIGLAK